MGARVLAAGSMLLLGVASAHADDKAAAGPDATAKLTGHVLVWQDADFILDAKAPAKTIKVVSLAKSRAESVGHVIAMKVIATKKDLVELETLDDLECAPSDLSAGESVRLRVFVARKDIAPVVTTAFSATYPDGSKIDIGVGVPVVEGANGTYNVDVGHERVAVAIPATSVGYTYANAKFPPPEPRVDTGPPMRDHHDDSFVIRAGTTAMLGDQKVTPGRTLSRSVITNGKTTLFPLDDRCVSAQLAVPSDRIDKASSPRSRLEGVGDIDHSDSEWDPTIPFVPKKTAVYVGALKIGTTSDRIALMSKKRPFCFDLHFAIVWNTDDTVATDPAPTLHACAPSSTKLVYNPKP